MTATGENAAEPESRAGANEPPDASTRGTASRQEKDAELAWRFWSSARGFWKRGGDRFAWLLSVGAIILILLNLAAQYGLNLWQRQIFDGLEKKDSQSVFLFSLLLFPLVAATVAIGVANVYARMTLQRRWRAWLNNDLVDHWLKNGRYYQLNLVRGDHDNPEYRIAQDLRVATDAPIDFAVGMLSAVLSAITFIFILWSVGGAISLPLGETSMDVPGFLVIAAIVYAAAGSGAIMGIGRQFVKVSVAVNQAEADYRYALTRVRENGESIALMRGEEEERSGLAQSLAGVLREWRNLCIQHMRTTIVSQGSSLVAPIVPLLLCAPKYLGGAMSLGEVMQSVSAFTIVQGAFGWLVDNYPRLADWRASAQRVASLWVSLDALEHAEAGNGGSRIHRGETSAAAVRLRNLSVTLDNGMGVISDADVTIQPGERVLLVGESGTGKSILVRAVAGLWPWGAGTIEVGAGARVLLLPQQPYVPAGRLKSAATYPAPVEQYPEEQVVEAFKDCGLDHLLSRIDEIEPWDQTLSGGEKQRLAFVRLLLHRPDIVVFDEATSALDPDSQESLMRLITTRLPNATLISVAHRPELEAFLNRKIVLERHHGPAHFVRDVRLRREERQNALGRWLRRLGALLERNRGLER
jgi:putative ATP-binding cassette transporter